MISNSLFSYLLCLHDLNPFQIRSILSLIGYYILTIAKLLPARAIIQPQNKTGTENTFSSCFISRKI